MNKTFLKILKSPVALFVYGFIFGSILVYVTLINLHTEGTNFYKDIRQENTKYKFIKPLLSSNYSSEDDTLKWFPEERRLKSAVVDEINNNPDIEVGMYFLNLTNSGWFGVNSSTNFIPASLLKLPMLISYYKLKETTPGLFEQQIMYEGKNFNTAQTMGTGKITAGNTYTVRELLEEMVKYSDNNALELLYKYKKDSLKTIFADIQIPLPDTDEKISKQDFMTTRDMARFLLVLYNSSYLNRSDSEDALHILSQTSFKDGLVAGIPSDVVISHKFGEREIIENSKVLLRELHDCGIVYDSKNPYILCIMTKGNDFTKQKAIIKNISTIVYQNVHNF